MSLLQIIASCCRLIVSERVSVWFLNDVPELFSSFLDLFSLCFSLVPSTRKTFYLGIPLLGFGDSVRWFNEPSVSSISMGTSMYPA